MQCNKQVTKLIDLALTWKHSIHYSGHDRRQTLPHRSINIHIFKTIIGSPDYLFCRVSLKQTWLQYKNKILCCSICFVLPIFWLIYCQTRIWTADSIPLNHLYWTYVHWPVTTKFYIYISLLFKFIGFSSVLRLSKYT